MLLWELLKILSEQLPVPGARPVLHRDGEKLALKQSLKEQGITSQTSLSCTFVPMDTWNDYETGTCGPVMAGVLVIMLRLLPHLSGEGC